MSDDSYRPPLNIHKNTFSEKLILPLIHNFYAIKESKKVIEEIHIHLHICAQISSLLPPLL